MNAREYKFNAESSELEILIYGTIASWNVGARWISDLLRQNPSAKTIRLRINSLGGSVFEGAAIHNVLARHPAKKEVDIDGVAASAASWIVMAGDVRRIGVGGFFMVHEASGDTWGAPAAEHEKTAALLRKMNAQQVDLYAKCAKLSRADIAKAVEAETWYSAAEALKAGFVTEVADGVELASAADLEDAFADYGFRNAPQAELGRFFSFAASPRRERIPAELLEQLSAQVQPPAREPSASSNGDTSSMNKKLLAQKLGLSESASDEAFEAAIVSNVDLLGRFENAIGKKGDDAHGTLLAWKDAASRLPKLQTDLEALKKTTADQELEAVIADGHKGQKLTPALEKQIRDDVVSADMTLKGAKAFVAALPPIKGLVAASDKREAGGKKTPGGSSLGSAAVVSEERATFNGKTYEAMTSGERQVLAKHDEDLFSAMRDDAHKRGLI